ncbi:MAG: universal stress protein [Gammaproteobacteria bacterium]|nr:universal stress protein [Gammaproteobacteria bacterium]
MINLKRILWPTDFSETSDAAQTYACNLAKQFDAELHIVHVIIDPAYAVSPMGVGYIPASYHEDMRVRSDAELAKLPVDSAADGLSVVRESLGGSAAENITDYAQEHDIGMIVIGTHGYSGLSRMLMGSVAEKVVRTAGCPVLTIHTDDLQFIKADD